VSDLWMWTAVAVSTGYATYRIVRTIVAVGLPVLPDVWWMDCQDCGKVSCMGEGIDGYLLFHDCDQCIGCSSPRVLPIVLKEGEKPPN